MFGLDDILGAASDYYGGGDASGDFSSMPDQGGNEWAKLLAQDGSAGSSTSALGDDQGTNEWAKLLQQDSSSPGSFYDTAAAASNSPSDITGIAWIDKILHGMGTSFDKNPLGMLSGGLGILNAIDRMRSGNNSPGQAQMSNLVASHMNTGANAPMTTPMKAPYGASAAQLIAIPQVKSVYNGPLTQTAYNPLNRK